MFINDSSLFGRMPGLEDYRRVAGDEIVDGLYEKAESLSGKHIVCVSSTYQGGGVAELLNSLVGLLNEAGVDMGWRILHGSPDFFTVTKKFHNALQGGKINLSDKKKKIYIETNGRFSLFTHLDHDLVIVHDPQPLPLISFYEKHQPWIFRCHVDLQSPAPELWNYLKGFVNKYDHFVVSKKEYMKELGIPQSVILPAIDPLSVKNKMVSGRAVEKCLKKHGIDNNKPIISQVSRFDKWKDPVGVVKVFEKVRAKKNCQLVLLGSFAADDPEGQAVFEQLEKKVEKCRFKGDIKLIAVENSFLVNCLQRASEVVVQKSIKEGFGLTVSEALYKGTPVVASKVGGIPMQVIDGFNGFLHAPGETKQFSKSIIRLLEGEKLRESLGKNGRDYVSKNFLMTRLMSDWLSLMQEKLGK
jgi:trehalose synthase